MRKFLGVAALLALAGCQSVGGVPVQVGPGRFQVSYAGSESAGLSAAQTFCQSRGYAYAAIVRHLGASVVFQCEHAGAPAQGRGATCMPTASGAKVCGVFH
jgi:hypothetical protein